MDNRQTLGFAGVAAQTIGVFTPLVSMPIIGSMSYINNGKGDGVIILGLAFVSLLILAARRYRLLWFTGLASLGLLAFTYVNISKAMALAAVSLADNPFAGLATMQLQWGWGVLIVGSVLVLAAAAVRPAAPPAQG